MKLEILQHDMYAAMKAQNKSKKEALSALIAAVKKAGIDKGCRDNIPEELVDAAIMKEVKTIKEMIDTCPASRVETLKQYKNRLRIAEEYAPKLIDDPNVIKTVIRKACEMNDIELISSNKGVIMKCIMPTMKGKYDMKTVNQCVGDLII